MAGRLQVNIKIFLFLLKNITATFSAGVQDPHQGEDRGAAGGEAEGRAAGGGVPAVGGDHGHPRAALHEEGRHAQIRRLRGNHSQPDSSILYVHLLALFSNQT